MIPRLKPYLGWRELAAALRPPRRDDVARFEAAFAAKMGQKNAVAFPYGRTGLVLLLQALGLKGREIICPAYTCVVVPHAIVASGNIPVFVDSGADDFNMDLDLVPELIGERTGAIIATSIFGYPVDLDRLDAILRRYPDLPVIQDCAHSFAASWKGRPVQREGIAAIFGLNISKLMTSVFGGMVTTDDDRLALRLRELREEQIAPPSRRKSLQRLFYLLAVYPIFWEPLYGLVNRLERSGFLDRQTKYYDEDVIDMPQDYLEGITPVEARVGAVQVDRYDEIVQRRRQNAARFTSQLDRVPALRLRPMVDGATYSHFVAETAHREPMLSALLGEGIQLGSLIEYSIPEMNAYRGYAVGQSFPNAARYSKSTINLPVYSGLNRQEVIITKLKRVGELRG